jgi:hypothetical protein
MIPAVAFRFKCDHIILIRIIIVDINIRHGYSFRIEEPLKQQVIWDRVDIRDPQTVAHPASGCGATSRSY